jgi:hypothetical protein
MVDTIRLLTHEKTKLKTKCYQFLALKQSREKFIQIRGCFFCNWSATVDGSFSTPLIQLGIRVLNNRCGITAGKA